MNKRIKSLVLSATLVASMAILGGCGSNNIGYVDTMKVANSTEKGIEITKEINAKKAELNKKLKLLMMLPNKTYITKHLKS